jgi:hypothetical protein
MARLIAASRYAMRLPGFRAYIPIAFLILFVGLQFGSETPSAQIGSVRIMGVNSAGQNAPIQVGLDSHSRTATGLTEDEHAIKATPGTLYSLVATNANAAERFVRCANATLANTTPGTTTPVLDLAIPANDVPLVVSEPGGIAFSAALTCWVVTGAAQNDVTEVAANEVKLFYTYR